MPTTYRTVIVQLLSFPSPQYLSFYNCVSVLDLSKQTCLNARIIYDINHNNYLLCLEYRRRSIWESQVPIL